MILLRLRCRPVSAFIALFAWAFPGILHAQQPVPQGQESTTVVVPQLGMDIFRYLLDTRGIDPVQNIDDVDRDTLIVLLGPSSIDRYLNGRLVQAVARGASIMIASNRATMETHEFGVRITGEDVESDVNNCYPGLNGNRFFRPYVRPIHKSQSDPSSPHSVFAGIDDAGANAVATYRTSVVRVSNKRSEPLAGFPIPSKIWGDDLHGDPRRSSIAYFAVGGTYGEGRFLVMADQFVFVNLMIWKTDDANLKFADNCVEWLQANGKKRKCLFIEDGKIKTDFALPFPPIKGNRLETILKAALLLEQHGDRIAGEMEEQDIFNKMILSLYSQRDIMRFALIAITVLLLMAGILRFLRSRAGPDPARTLITPDLASLIPRGSVLQQRFEGQLQLENVYEPLRSLIRDFLSGLDPEPDSQGRPPRIEIEPGYKDQAGLRRRIERIWQLGYGTLPAKVKPRELPEITDDLKEILEDADNGWWKFVAS